MADGGEGEDEIQFLRTVSLSAAAPRLSEPLCVRECACESARVVREFTALGTPAPLHPSHGVRIPRTRTRGRMEVEMRCRTDGGTGVNHVRDAVIVCQGG